jgi:glycosyltransferase involved in cell wall biosynthesis
MIRFKPCVLSPAYHPWTDLYEKSLGRFIMTSANIIIAQCEYEKNYLLRYVPERKIKVVPCGIDSEKYEDLPDPSDFRRRYNFSPSTRMILYVGPLSGHKRVAALVDCMPEVLKSIKDSKLVIIGQGSRRQEIVSRIRQLRLKREVLVLGGVPDKALMEAYAATDVFVLPSEHESFGIVLLESAACGKPIVSTKVGVASELIHDGKTGLLCEPNRLDELSDFIVKVLTDERFTEGALLSRDQVLKNYRWDNIVRKIERIYYDLTSV